MTKQNDILSETVDYTRFEKSATNKTSNYAQNPSKGSLERIRYSMETHLYQSYLAEVAALNHVKSFLSERRGQISKELRSKLINQIMNMQTKLTKFELNTNNS